MDYFCSVILLRKPDMKADEDIMITPPSTKPEMRAEDASYIGKERHSEVEGAGESNSEVEAVGMESNPDSY